jgi:RNA polymerase sigma-70 factor (ECF subfamily)
MNDYKAQFSEIYDQYIEKIYRFVYLKVGTQEVAQDITSHVFTKAWESYNSKEGKIDNINAFLYRIARNAVIDHYRTRDRSKTVSSESVPQAVDTRTSALDAATLNADMEVVKAAIQGMRKDYQDVIILHYLEDMPVAEIATIVQKSPVYVRVMLHRGLNMLKDQLRGEA